MSDKWIITHAKAVGVGHEDYGIPCQDAVLSKTDNGVTVIALSDGCGSEPFAEYGAEITVNVLCNLFAENFDELFALDAEELKRLVVKSVTDQVRGVAKANDEVVEEYKAENPHHFENYMRGLVGFEIAKELYDLTLFNATVQFVAVKGERIIIGRLGDGVICDLRGGVLRILSEEDKINVKKNETVYPTTLMLVDSKYSEYHSYDRFEIIRGEDASAYDMLMIMSDGTMDAVAEFNDATKEKRLNSESIRRLLSAGDNIVDIFEKEYKFMSGIEDDLSVIILKKTEDPIIESVVCRKYDTNGSTVDNTRTISVKAPKAEKKPEQKKTPAPKKEKERRVKEKPELDPKAGAEFLGGESMKRASEYFFRKSDADRFKGLVLQIYGILKTEGTAKLDSIRDQLDPTVDDVDWVLLMMQIKKLGVFNIDKDEMSISGKDN